MMVVDLAMIAILAMNSISIASTLLTKVAVEDAMSNNLLGNLQRRFGRLLFRANELPAP